MPNALSGGGSVYSHAQQCLNASKAEQTELLAKLEISLRLLAGRLGISQDGLSRKAAMTLKAALVQEDVSAWKSDLLTVLHELEET